MTAKGALPSGCRGPEGASGTPSLYEPCEPYSLNVELLAPTACQALCRAVRRHQPRHGPDKPLSARASWDSSLALLLGEGGTPYLFNRPYLSSPAGRPCARRWLWE